jgi:hypothetical protein
LEGKTIWGKTIKAFRTMVLPLMVLPYSLPVTCHTGSIFFGTSAMLNIKKDRATPALTQARDDMIMLLAVPTPIIGSIAG